MTSSNPTSLYTIVLLGSGGREHALAWKLRQSQSVGRLVCAPGNPGMATLGELWDVDIENGEAVTALVHELRADLVVIGPEALLAEGVSDILRSNGFAVFGPSQAAARLEWDKSFAKDFMARHNIPAAASRTFTAENIDEGRGYIARQPLPIVLKASGLAAGKGVVIAETTEEAIQILEEMLSGKAFGAAGAAVVVEEFMNGEEASVFAITDGTEYVVLAPSQDHKRVGDGDAGPNTGGMGAFAPAPVVTGSVMEQVRQNIIEPTLQGMKQEGTPYSGCLFVGLMIENGNARVVEFNSRFGDPETQVILPILHADLGEMFMAAATGRMKEIGEVTSSGTAVCVVMASGGYPGSYEKGKRIDGTTEAEEVEGVTVFHAGTRAEGETIVTAGGRVLGVTAVTSGDDLQHALDCAYEGVRRITFAGAIYRTDIGAKGLRARQIAE